MIVCTRSNGQERPAIAFDEATTISPGFSYTLSNIYFEIDRHKMKPKSMEELERLFSVLQDNPRINIRIEGHVCCIKEAPDALDIDNFEPNLSLNRAKEVYDNLTKMGIDPSRLSYIGLGRSKPVIANERSREDAAKNMRVEFVVVSE
ncbi:MAG: OmpA family protein [Chitinophagaceae bacterium]|nr:OmpA family protein [Chitinophagaceae bacterium]